MSRRFLNWIFVSLMVFTLLLPGLSFAAGPDWNNVVDEVQATLDQALQVYDRGEVEEAKKIVQEAYFGAYEAGQLEQAIKFNISSQRNALIEEEFRQIRVLMTAEAPNSEVEQRMTGLVEMLRQDAAELGGASQSTFALFLSSFSIIVREGFEAILILGAIIAYLIKSGNRDKVKVIYQSTLAAIGASVLTAVAVKYIFQISGAGQEILEGVTMLIAVAVLFSVSFWLISKVEAQKWKNYIEGKIKASLNTGSTVALWSAAFLAVYREGAETVLFYQALLSGQAGGLSAIGLGFILGSLALVAIFAVVRYGSIRLPLKPFFVATSVLLYYLAFVFAGQGMKELQEGGVFTSTQVAGVPVINFLGIYPTAETLSLQGLLVLAALAGLGYQWFSGRKQRLEKEVQQAHH